MTTLRADLAALDAAVTLAELQRAVIAAEAAAGWNVPDAARPLTTAEAAAGVRFADLDAMHARHAAAVLKASDPVAALVTAWVTAQVAGVPAGVAAARLLAAQSPLTALGIPGLRQAVTDATTAGVAVLQATWRETTAAVRGEARHQGARSLPPPVVWDADTRAMAKSGITALLSYRITRILDVAVTTTRTPARGDTTLASPPGSGTAADSEPAGGRVAAAIAAIAIAGALDLARQAVTQTQAAARTRQATATGMPGIREIYASELLDTRTCPPCAVIDGHVFATIAEARVHYPGHGGYGGCLGGLRCRGTLVFVWDTEHPASPPQPSHPQVVPGRPGRVVSDGDIAAARRAILDKYGGLVDARAARGDVDAAAVLDAVGYSGRPLLLDTDDFDAYHGLEVRYGRVEEPTVEFARGFHVNRDDTTSAYLHAQVLQSDDYWVGTGMYGSGTYIGDYPTAHSFAQSRRGYPGALVYVKLDPATRLVPWTALPDGIRGRAGLTIRWCAARGYHGIDCSDQDDRAGILILDRGKLVVERRIRDVHS